MEAERGDEPPLARKLLKYNLIDDHTLCFTIGDVSGKGVPAALFMVITKILLKNEALRGLPTTQILHNVNNIIAADNETAMFVTILCGVLDLKTGALEIGNAGHNPPLISSAGRDFEYIQIPRCFVLGPMADTPFTCIRFHLKPGDTLFLYTDGVTEACNSASEQFSDERLRACLSRRKASDLKDILSGIQGAINGFARGEPQFDDITMMTVRYMGG